MKNISIFLEDKVKKIEVPLELDKDNFYHDLYAVLGELMFNYNQANVELSKEEFQKNIDRFIEQFFD